MNSIFKIDSKRLALCAVFGGAAFVLRAFNLTVPIGGPFVIDLRGVPGIVGAALTGPIGGLVVGILAGIPANFPFVDIPAFATAYFLVGLATSYLKSHKWLGAFTVVTGHLVAATIVRLTGLVSSFMQALILLLPRALVLIPIQITVLYLLYKRWPELDTIL